MGGLLHAFDKKLQENRLYNWIQDFSHKRIKKFWNIYVLAVPIEKSTVLRVIKTQNTMLLDEFSVILLFFALKNVKTEFVNSIFLTNSA